MTTVVPLCCDDDVRACRRPIKFRPKQSDQRSSPRCSFSFARSATFPGQPRQQSLPYVRHVSAGCSSDSLQDYPPASAPSLFSYYFFSVEFSWVLICCSFPQTSCRIHITTTLLYSVSLLTSFLYCSPKYVFLRQDAPACTYHTILMATCHIIFLGFISSIKCFLPKDAPTITFTNSARLLSPGCLSHHSCVCHFSLAW